VLIARDDGGLYALTSLCTHLCCDLSGPFGVIGMVGGKSAIQCKCHGSAFFADGSVASGPALLALDAHPLALGCDGVLYVDTTSTVPSTQRLTA